MWNYSIKNCISINLFIALTTPIYQFPIVRFAAARQSTIPSSYGTFQPFICNALRKKSKSNTQPEVDSVGSKYDIMTD